jgi:tripeptidyl-peptidase-1
MHDNMDAPLVNSVSYALPEDYIKSQTQDHPKFWPPGYIEICERELAKLCVRGISVLSGAGDGGATNAGRGLDLFCGKLHPMYPASSAFVTSVSATQVWGELGEVAVSGNNTYGVSWTTGGGFSSVVPRPAWQNQAVTAALKAARQLPSSSLFNSSMRAFPDLSAVGHNIPTVFWETYYNDDGSSDSTPIVAGLVARLNTALLQAGRPSLGFLNPLLYQLYGMSPDTFFNDVVIGSNHNGDSISCPVDNGYSCQPGYDFVSGIGSPRIRPILKSKE